MNTSFASAECGNVWNIVMSVYKARTCQCCFASVQKISCCWSVFRHNHQVIYAKARAFLLVSNQNNVRREKQHNSQCLWNKGNGLKKSFTSTSPPLDSPLHSHIEALQKHGSIRTKCLPCRSAEGGTSTAIRANWLYLRSVQECWH